MDVLGGAASDLDPETVVKGFKGLLTLFPRLPQVDRLQLGCYAGYWQDIGDQPGQRLCELVDGTMNVIVALPSGLVGPWLNVISLRHIIEGLVNPSGSQPPLPARGAGVQVGDAVESTGFRLDGLG